MVAAPKKSKRNGVSVAHASAPLASSKAVPRAELIGILTASCLIEIASNPLIAL